MMAASLIASPLAVFAQTDANDIVQLNNLTITNVNYTSAGVAALITAQAPGVACLKYFDYRASQGFAYPCPAQTHYQIKIDSRAILLLRNRSRASMSDFAVGDGINVYGFLDAGGVNMDALIMRDVSKPAVRQFTQINAVTVTSVPDSFAPTSFTVTQTPYCAPGFACALYARNYTITVGVNTLVLYRDRRAMPLSEMQAGDTLNVYGSYVGERNTLDAIIIRDLSRPGVTPPPVPPPLPPAGGNQAPVITAVGGPTNLQVNQVGTWTISAYDPDNNNNNLTYRVTWGDENTYGYGYAAAPSMQSNMQTGTFTHSYRYAGTYTIWFTVTDSTGLFARSSLTVTVGVISSTDAPFITSLAPSSGQVGSIVTISGSGFTTSNTIYFGGYGAFFNVYSADGHTLSFAVPSAISPCGNNPQCMAPAFLVGPGNYNVYISNVFGTSNQVGFIVQ